MSVKLHKVTLFVVDPGDGDALGQLWGDCNHNAGAHIVETQTAEFDRPWEDADLLNNIANLKNRAILEDLVKHAPVVDETMKP